MATYEIPTTRLDWLKVKFAQLDRKARALGLEPMTYKILETKVVEKKDPHTFKTYLDEVAVIETKGQPPVINGWKFVAILEHEPEGNIIRNISGDEIPTKYRTRSAVCDHCKLKRERKDTYVLRKVGTLEYKQVGKTCLKDFTGHNDPAAAAAVADMYSDLVQSLEESEEYITSRTDIQGLIRYLSFVIASIKKHGWTSRKEAEESYDKAATADVAQFWLEDVAKRKRTEEPEDEDIEKAKKAIEWITNLKKSELQNEFMHNIHIIAKSGVVKLKQIGMAAAIPMTYDRAMAQARLIESSNEYQGTIGDRGNFIVKLIRVHVTESAYGTTHIYNFQDEKGNILVWMSTSKQDMKDGETYNLACTIKAHKEYKGMKQTQLTRCKIMPMGEQITEGQKKARVSAQQSKAKKEERLKQKSEEDYRNYTIEYSEPYEKNVLKRLNYEINTIQNRINDFRYGNSEWGKKELEKMSNEIAKREKIIDDHVENTIEKNASIKDGSGKYIRSLRIFSVYGVEKYIISSYDVSENHPYYFHELKNETFEEFITRTHIQAKDAQL